MTQSFYKEVLKVQCPKKSDNKILLKKGKLYGVIGGRKSEAALPDPQTHPSHALRLHALRGAETVERTFALPAPGEHSKVLVFAFGAHCFAPYSASAQIGDLVSETDQECSVVLACLFKYLTTQLP